MTRYTVFAVYENDYQPYATTIDAADPIAAMDAAQAEADLANGDHCELVGFQVVIGDVEVVA